MNRTLLLSGTAIISVLATTPLMAGSIGTGNNMNVSLSGEVRFQAHTGSQDKDSSVRQTGFKTDEAELAISASNSAEPSGLLIINSLSFRDKSLTEYVFRLFIFLNSVFARFPAIVYSQVENLAISL